MRPVQPSVVAVQRHVMLSAVPSSGIVNSVIRITGIGDRDRPEWLIRINGMRSYLAPAWNADWVVYAKRPFAGPAQVLEYVGRYTHRVAISNNRLVSIDDGKVRFRWKDYRDDNRQKAMTLAAAEFIRRFLIHVLPDGFHRIRYFGFLSNCRRAKKLALCRKLLGMAPAEPAADPPADYRDRFEALTGQSLRECPHCHTGIMVVVDCIARPKVCQAGPDTS
jgi:hypothetical protein